jgi:hypothetical protein
MCDVEWIIHYTLTCICNLEHLGKVLSKEQGRKPNKHFNNSVSLTNNSV